jgi:threonine/homoserine/homoserine lactone efflux protein
MLFAQGNVPITYARIHNMILSFSVAALFSGIGIGFMVAAPIGPMGILCIQRTLASGIATGLATGLGAATVHLAYSAVVVIGLGVIVQPWIDAHTLALSVLSGIIMLTFAIRANRASIVLQESVQSSRIRLSRAYLSAIVIAITNPLTIILFFAALQAFASQSSPSPLVAGVFIGSVAWWIILSGVAAVARVRLNAKVLRLSGRLASLTLFALAAFTLLRVAGRLLVL